jgi:ribosomal protein S18 acetylase RimI-like enzyme
VTLTIAPFPVDLPASLALAQEALKARLAPGEQLDDILPSVDSGIRTGRLNGGLLRSEGTVRGIVTWEPAGPLGSAIRLFYLAPPDANLEEYRSAFEVAERAAGPIAFAPGPLAGLSPEVEESFMRERGFAPYGRSEMVLPASTIVPALPAPAGVTVRPLRLDDEHPLARLHEQAYQDHLDRYLAVEEIDPVRDADRQLRDYFGGRYGDVLSPGSSVAAEADRIVAAVIVTRHTGRALIIDVMTEPGRQGTGLGRAVLADAIRALRARGESPIVLNVTEGNDRAVRLYSRLGFVRTIGPSREWYDARRIRVTRPSNGPR